MKKLNVPFYVSTNNKHTRCLQIFVELFNKFTDNSELIILGYDKPDFELTENCKFESMGVQGPVEEWSTDLRKYLLKNAPEYFIYGTEDLFFYKNMDFDFINYLIKIVRLNEKIGKVQLVNTGEENGFTIIENEHYKTKLLKTVKVPELNLDFDLHILEKSNYSINCQTSIWNKECMMEYLVDGQTPWEFELKGSWEASWNDEWYSMILDRQYGVFKKEGFCSSLEPKEQWTYKEGWLHLLDNNELKSIVKNWK